MRGKLKAIGFPEWNEAIRPATPDAGMRTKYVLQYPPGTGFVLALFPAGFQVIPLYVLASLVVVGFSFARDELRGNDLHVDAGGRLR